MENGMFMEYPAQGRDYPDECREWAKIHGFKKFNFQSHKSDEETERIKKWCKENNWRYSFLWLMP